LDYLDTWVRAKVDGTIAVDPTKIDLLGGFFQKRKPKWSW